MENTDCEKILNLIPLYIDNCLLPDDADTVRRHISCCDTCKKEYEFLSSLISTAKNLDDTPISPDFHKNLMNKASTLKAKKRTLLIKRSSAGLVAAAVVALCFVSLGNMTMPENAGDSTDTPTYASETSRIAPRTGASESFIVARISANDTNRKILTEILSAYEKDDFGYIVPDIESVLQKLTDMGIEASTQAGNRRNYIILE